ncbi:hypothetical protein HZA86_03105 [Candidatus Uhrbacteria bacterium]|nr:hypothetical protein [Candidatus Uhrbacteria bacterium]
MPYKIGIFGSAVVESDEVVDRAKRLATALVPTQAILITGSCSGLPYAIAYEAAQQGVEVWGFSPKQNEHDQRQWVPHDDITIYKNMVYVPPNFPFAHNDQVCRKYRNVISTAHCDAGIIVAGRWGTLNEFTNLVDMGKVVGVLTETGGIADELPGLFQRIRKETSSVVVFNSNPEQLVHSLMVELGKRSPR